MKLTIEQASKILGLSYVWTYQLFKQGRIELNKASLKAYKKNKNRVGRPVKYKGE